MWKNSYAKVVTEIILCNIKIILHVGYENTNIFYVLKKLLIGNDLRFHKNVMKCDHFLKQKHANLFRIERGNETMDCTLIIVSNFVVNVTQCSNDWFK